MTITNPPYYGLLHSHRGNLRHNLVDLNHRHPQFPQISFILKEEVQNSSYTLLLGVICTTAIGPIQFGIPPETVKDSLILGIEVPTYYIIPTNKFDKKYAISVAEFEFPAYFNYFVKKRRITLICTKNDEAAIRTIFQETLLGPTKHDELEKDFYYKFPKAAYPDFQKELSVFSRNPSNLTERLTIDHLLAFLIYDEKDQVEIVENNKIIRIVKANGEFKITEKGQTIYTIKDEVKLPDDYNQYIDQKKVDDFKHESMPQLPTSLLKEYQHRSSIQLSPTMLHKLPEQSFEDKFDSIMEKPYKRDDKKKTSILIWQQGGGAHVSPLSQVYDNYNEDQGQTFTPPDFGVTVLGCSHGFDPRGSTSGYIFWTHGRGIMVDPPPFSSYQMKMMGVPYNLICAVIISHCHADHDAGTFQKILQESRVEIITTRTIMKSFLKKYSAISGFSADQLLKLFIFRPVIIGTTLNIYGAHFDFFYAMHTIPSLGFSVRVDKKSIYFSSDTFYDPDVLLKYKNEGILSQLRYEMLAFPDFKEDIILHEAGVPPIHTPQSVLAKLPNKIKNKLYLVHTAEKDFKKEYGLKIAKPGITNTMILIPSNTNKHIDTLRRIDLLSNIDLFEHLTIKNIRWLLDALQEEIYEPEEAVTL